MASSSTSSIDDTSFKYDVFLSFSGEDTGTNFVDHLYHALEQESIETYKDDEKLEKGERIELFEAIEGSRFHVVVFSKHYASSSWCLDELVKIMECQETTTEHIVYPIFYHVEPTEVRKQSGKFGNAFAKHEKAEAAQKWREALKEAANLSGWELKGPEVEFIKMLVNKISLKLPSTSVDENLIGMRTRIHDVLSSLNVFPDKFCMIGITGMGGIGKTTLARAVFDQICNQFEGSSFVENVRESSNSLLLGLKSLQQQILRDVLNDQKIIITGNGETMMKNKMRGRKVLVVLDDVDHINQLKALANAPNWFKSGSKIIITTRDKQVLLAHKVVNSIHEVNLLTDEEAICLLSRCAFGTEKPSQEYEELSRKVVCYASGLPLTITILGSSLYDEEKDEWINTLKKLEKIPLGETLQKLELSYIKLDEDQKEIFLDVACMLKGWKKDEAIKVLESRGFHAISGLRVLQKKYLITISRDGGLGMHDHTQEMGRYIVRRSNLDEPRIHTRLWIQEEIEDILAKDLGAEARCMHLSHVNTVAVIKGIGNMKKLRFLHVQGSAFSSNSKLDVDSQYFPNSLQYLKWKHYPFRSLPKTFQASNLVGLDMSDIRMEQLWEGGERKVLHKLRFLQLSRSNLRTFDLGLTPNLEVLDLQYCSLLEELHMSVGCPKLKYLNLYCSKLRTLHLRLTNNLETLNLTGCGYLEEIRIFDDCPKLKSLDLRFPKLRILELGLTPNIETLKVNCHKLEELRTYDEFDGLDDLVKHLISVGCPKLNSLELADSKLRTLELTLNLKKLFLQHCSLVELQIPIGDVKLESLDLEMCLYLKTLDLGRTPNLKSLHLDEGCSSVKLHAPVGGLKKLIHLSNPLCLLKSLHFDISGPAGLLPELNLSAKYSIDRWQLPPLKKFAKFQFEGFVRADLRSSIGNIENLISVGLSNRACTDLESFFGSICGLQHLRKLTLKGSIPEAPKDLDRLQCLEELTLTSTDIKHLPDSICMIKYLKNLELYGCMALEKLPEDLDRLECLEILILSECVALEKIPNKICRMKCLKYFGLSYCKKVKEFPEELGRLECLEELNVEGTCLNHLPQSILSMKKGLRIVGSRELFESCDLTSNIQTSEYETFCYI